MGYWLPTDTYKLSNASIGFYLEHSPFLSVLIQSLLDEAYHTSRLEFVSGDLITVVVRFIVNLHWDRQFVRKSVCQKIPLSSVIFACFCDSENPLLCLWYSLVLASCQQKYTNIFGHTGVYSLNGPFNSGGERCQLIISVYVYLSILCHVFLG